MEFLKKNDTLNYQFLDASSHLYKRVCPSVDSSVGRSVGPGSIGHAFVKIAKNRRFVLVCVMEWSGVETIKNYLSESHGHL